MLTMSIPRTAWPALASAATLFALLALAVILAVRATPIEAQSPSPIVVNATPTLAPPPGLSRPIVAYGAPGGPVIGPIEAGRPYVVVARAGIAWVQLDVAGSGLVWTEASAVDGVDMAALADLQPPPTPVPPTQAPPLQAPAWQPAHVPAPATAAPEQLYQIQPVVEQSDVFEKPSDKVQPPFVAFGDAAIDCLDPLTWHPPCAPIENAPAISGGSVEGQP